MCGCLSTNTVVHPKQTLGFNQQKIVSHTENSWDLTNTSKDSTNKNCDFIQKTEDLTDNSGDFIYKNGVWTYFNQQKQELNHQWTGFHQRWVGMSLPMHRDFSNQFFRNKIGDVTNTGWRYQSTKVATSQWGHGETPNMGWLEMPMCKLMFYMARNHYWLVVCNINELLFYIYIYWEFHHPNWLSYFSEGWLNHQPD